MSSFGVRFGLERILYLHLLLFLNNDQVEIDDDVNLK